MKKTLNISIIILFIAGISLVTYSIFQLIRGEQMVNDKMTEAEKIIEEGQKNNTPPPPPLVDVEGNTSLENQMDKYKGQALGILEVPSLDLQLPIVEGTDEDDLSAGVGHYEGTALPAQNEQIVLSGHNNTVFKDFGELKIGDTFVVKMPYGNYEYMITSTDIVDAEDRTVIRPRGEELLTVTTCYPFGYFGDTPERFIFYAEPVIQTGSNN